MFAYLGRLKKYKGVHLVIRAFAAMADPSATLEIAGAGDYRPQLEALARSLDLGERVRFLGRISEVGEARAAAPRLGAGVRVAQGGVGNHESRSGRVRDAGRRVELAGHSRVGARRTHRLSRAARRRRRDGRRDAAARRIARAGRVAWRRGAGVRREVYLGARGDGDGGAFDARRRTRDGRRPMTPKLTVGQLIERMQAALQLEHVERPDGLDRVIENPNVSSPGLALAGYVERFPSRRLQVLGETEITYLKSLDADVRRVT